MDFGINAVYRSENFRNRHLPSARTISLAFANTTSRFVIFLFAAGMMHCATSSANGDPEFGRSSWEYVCKKCHGKPQPHNKAAFSEYGTTAYSLAYYASYPSAITKSANEGFIIPEGNTNDKEAPGGNTNGPMGSWAGMAPKRLGVGVTPSQYAIDISAYFATYFSPPNDPVISSVVAGNAQATVTFSAPKSELAISSYSVTANPGGQTATASASPITVSGLTNGTDYTFTVSASSNAGTSKPSLSSNAVTPIVATVAVAAPPVVAHSTPPALPIAAIVPAVAPVVSQAVAAAVKPLTPSLPVSVQNVAPSVPAAPVLVQTPKALASNNSAAVIDTLPVPSDLKARPGNAEARVYFSVPADSASSITGFTVSALANGAATAIKATGVKSPITVKGLNNGDDYTFIVTAQSKAGSSAASYPSNPVTPLKMFGD
jgi:hypothetical protein